jgi:monofunctional chorismate mutase
MISIRGATTIQNDKAEEILSATSELLQKTISANQLDINQITAIIFTCTKDISSTYPAKAARDLGIAQAALMCVQEMYVENSLPKCIRICIFYNHDILAEEIKHIYLKNAAILRPDLIK